jgi:hypothetical protein
MIQGNPVSMGVIAKQGFSRLIVADSSAKEETYGRDTT